MSDNSVNYGYYGGVTATYGYRPNSDQIATTTITSSTGTELLTHSRTYEGADRLKSVVASRNGAVVEGYMWGYDGAGRRKTATISGGERSGDWWDYSYNNRGEVIGGVRRNAAGQVSPGYEFGYSFDAIGNRIESWREAAGSRSAYTANVLNQYESRTVPGEVRVEGQAEPGSALVRLQVDGEPAAPFTVGDGRLFSAKAPVDNTTAPQYPELTIEAVKPGGGNATDWRQVQGGRQFVAQTPEVYTHDADGNLTSDGRWTYEWDAENRLIGMETQPAAVPAGVPKMRLEFAYDARHRRIRKVVKKNWDETASEYTHHEDRRFLYDEGWNLLAEQVVINQMPPESMTYLWGLDLSGTRQGAGGVGGLLSVTRLVNSIPKTYLPCYDGNGNVVRLVSENGSEADTVYEYGPFGELLRATGPMAERNPFRFSTHYADMETGHVNAKRRHYSPAMGRWVSLDPIGEDGGENLSSYCRNATTHLIDPFGEKFAHYTSGYKLAPKTLIDISDGRTAAITLHGWQFGLPTLSSDGGRFCLVQLNGAMQPVIEINWAKAGLTAQNIRLLPYDGGGNTVEHEEEHVRIYGVWWNKFVDEANQFEGRCFCTPECRQDLMRYIKTLFDVNLAGARRENAVLDIQRHQNNAQGPRTRELVNSNIMLIGQLDQKIKTLNEQAEDLQNQIMRCAVPKSL